MKKILFLLLPSILNIYCKQFRAGPDGGMNIDDEEDANIDEFPFTVIVQTHYPDDNITFTYLGVYISQHWVVTAADFIEDLDNESDEFLPVKGDAITLIMEMDDMTHKDYQMAHASKAILHPSYHLGVFDCEYNIGLIKIENPFKITPKAQIATLPDKSIDYIGSSVTMVGWNEETEKLKKRRLTVIIDHAVYDVDRANCICVNDSIPGDCGGILIYQNLIIGISSSFGFTYQNIYSHLPWIYDKTKKGTIPTRSDCVDISPSNCFEVLILFITISKTLDVI